MLNMASNLNILGKKAGANKLVNQMKQLMKDEKLSDKRFNLRLFKGVLNLSLKKTQEGFKYINSIED